LDNVYLRTVKARGSKGVHHEYVRLVESYREDGKNKQRIVCNLGRKDVLVDHLPALVRLLGGERSRVRLVDGDQLEAVGAWDWGPMLVVRHLWVALGLDQILQQQAGRGPADAKTFSDRVLVLVANRLCKPSSEHGLARWLETDFVCDRTGRRWLPQWRDDAVRKRSRTPRVRVELSQLKQWYRTLDQLKAGKETIEKQLYLQLRDLFSLKVDLALYDSRRPILKARRRRRSNSMAIAGMASRAIAKSFSAAFWSMDGRSLITSLPEIREMQRRSRRS
jgi:hypothetical protein